MSMKTMQRIKLASDEAASRKGFVLAMLLFVPFTLPAPSSPRGAETFSSWPVSATIAWDDHNAQPVEFRVYLRRAVASTYTTFESAGTNRVFTFNALQRKTTYKCFVIAVKNGLTSFRSEELTFRTGNKNSDVEEL